MDASEKFNNVLSRVTQLKQGARYMYRHTKTKNDKKFQSGRITAYDHCIALLKKEIKNTVKEERNKMSELVKIEDFDYFGNSFLLALEHFNFKPTYRLVSECHSSYWGGEGNCMCNSHPSAVYDVYLPSWLYAWLKTNSWANETFTPGNEQNDLTERIINELTPFFKVSEIIDESEKDEQEA